ncbi:MAG TPA: hypothetical protein VG753_01760 [Candidatus Paceibacterota bacterium]|nr:hypothetical protein [Candidatus Paceibacterota bacterium]
MTHNRQSDGFTGFVIVGTIMAAILAVTVALTTYMASNNIRTLASYPTQQVRQ